MERPSSFQLARYFQCGVEVLRIVRLESKGEHEIFPRAPAVFPEGVEIGLGFSSTEERERERERTYTSFEVKRLGSDASDK